MSGLTRRSVRFLEEMGLTPVWTPRRSAATNQAVEAAVAAEPATAEIGPERIEPIEPIQAATLFADAPHQTFAPATIPAAGDDLAGLPDHYQPQTIARMDWTTLKETVAGCVKCGLCRNRTNTVFGVGDEKAKWLFIGEGPGRNEDLQGEPFVGQAGKLLDNMLAAMQLQRGENAYIANVVKCRPTDDAGRDRPPSAEEAAACLPYLERQIALIQPSVLVALGKTAALSLLGLNPATPVGKLRGTVHRYAGLPLIVTYHPAYLLRNLPEKGKAWADLCMAMQTYAGAGTAANTAADAG